MRPIRPNSKGIWSQDKPQTIRIGGNLNRYEKPNLMLRRLDKLRSGDKPKICVTRTRGGLGDVLMTLPTVRAIAQKYDIQVDYGTDFVYLDGALHEVLQGNPYIKEVMPHQKVNSENYDAVLDLTCPCVAHEVQGAPPINRIDLFARHLGIRLENHDIDYYITPEEVLWAQSYIAEAGLSRYRKILVQPFSSVIVRDAPISKLYQALIKVLSYLQDTRLIILTHDTDNIKHEWRYNEMHIAHNLGTREIAALIPEVDLVVCPDSAVLHLAAALHHKTLTIFGPTDPNARINYHPEAVAIWPGKELANYPLWYDRPPGPLLCWTRLEEDIIAKSIVALMNNRPLPQSRDFVTFGNYQIENQFYSQI